MTKKVCGTGVMGAVCDARGHQSEENACETEKNRKITTRNSSLALCTPVYVVNETNDVSDAREPDECAATVQYV